jgi:hypothetical protein
MNIDPRLRPHASRHFPDARLWTASGLPTLREPRVVLGHKDFLSTAAFSQDLTRSEREPLHFCRARSINYPRDYMCKIGAALAHQSIG